MTNPRKKGLIQAQDRKIYAREIEQKIYGHVLEVPTQDRKKLITVEQVIGYHFKPNESGYETIGLATEIQENHLWHLQDLKVLEKVEIFIEPRIVSGTLEYNEVSLAHIKVRPSTFIKHYLGENPLSEKKIKTVWLDIHKSVLIINEEVGVSFKRKRLKRERNWNMQTIGDIVHRDEEMSKDETKRFKVFEALWEHRKEFKHGKNVVDINRDSPSDPMPIGQIAKMADCSVGAVRNHLKAVRKMLRPWPILIESSGTGLYQLTIHLS